MTTDWLSAGAMLLAGLIVGFMFWYGLRDKGRAVARPDTELRDLEAKRDLLLQELRDIKETGGSDDERRRLERETADVLRKIDARKAAPAASAAKSKAAVAMTEHDVAAMTRAATVRGFVWGALSVAILGGIGVFVWQKATPKTDQAAANAPMQSAQSQQQAADPALQQIEAAVAKSPDDLEMRNELAKAYLERDNLMGVFEQTQYVLKRSPDDARALTYQSLVRLYMGQPQGAMEMLQRAIKIDPQLTDAYVALAWADVQTGKTDDAAALIAEAGKRRPDQKARLDEVFTRMQAQAKNAPQQAAAMPPNHPGLPAPGSDAPVSGGPMAASAPAAAAAGPGVHVTVTLAGNVKPSPSAVLFIIARAAGQTAGPPAAVKRIMGATFPLEVDLTAADSMMGQPLPPNVRIEARLDSDGDPLTKPPTDPRAEQDGVATGSKVALVLK